jgi:DSF synthase
MELISATKTLLDTQYKQISTRFDSATGVLWTFLDMDDVPCVTLELLSELQHHHQAIENSGGQLQIGNDMHDIRYSVSASLTPGVFNLGGQLSLFRQLIRSKNRVMLMHYATECVNMLFSRLSNFNTPLTTVALVQGDALGGGFEGVLVSDVIIAEKGSHMGFPEILFNLFPGMGAYSTLARKVGPYLAEKLILSGKIYEAEELHAMGVVDILVSAGSGLQAVNEFIRKHERRANGFQAVMKARQQCNPVTYKEMMGITSIWVDHALRLSEKDLKVMDRFVRSQEKAFLPQQQEHGREYLTA